jgi:uncharacterized protein YndB with AHSA1/START domain
MVRREIVLPASREEVWAALTRPEELSEWFGAEVEIDARPRGAVAARGADGSTRRGTVLAINTPYRLVVVWEPEADGGGGSRLELTLEPVSDGTRLTVNETLLTASAPERLLLETIR